MKIFVLALILPLVASQECWNICPTTCLLGDVNCPNPPDEVNGCPTGSFCMPADVGCPIQCPEPPLPMECNWETEMSCPTMDGNGCYMGDYCLNVMDGDCPITCPMTCSANDVLCTPPPDANGCNMGSFCAPADVGCPIECPEPPPPMECNWETEMPCPTMDGNGCYMGDFCLNFMDGDCPIMCPMTCSANDVLCTPPPDANGCVMGSFCAPADIGCPIICPPVPEPVECGSEEMSCPSMDPNGCSMGDFCMPIKA